MESAHLTQLLLWKNWQQFRPPPTPSTTSETRLESRGESTAWNGFSGLPYSVLEMPSIPTSGGLLLPPPPHSTLPLPPFPPPFYHPFNLITSQQQKKQPKKLLRNKKPTSTIEELPLGLLSSTTFDPEVQMIYESSSTPTTVTSLGAKNRKGSSGAKIYAKKVPQKKPWMNPLTKQVKKRPCISIIRQSRSKKAVSTNNQNQIQIKSPFDFRCNSSHFEISVRSESGEGRDESVHHEGNRSTKTCVISSVKGLGEIRGREGDYPCIPSQKQSTSKRFERCPKFTDPVYKYGESNTLNSLAAGEKSPESLALRFNLKSYNSQQKDVEFIPSADFSHSSSSSSSQSSKSSEGKNSSRTPRPLRRIISKDYTSFSSSLDIPAEASISIRNTAQNGRLLTIYCPGREDLNPYVYPLVPHSHDSVSKLLLTTTNIIESTKETSEEGSSTNSGCSKPGANSLDSLVQQLKCHTNGKELSSENFKNPEGTSTFNKNQENLSTSVSTFRPFSSLIKPPKLTLKAVSVNSYSVSPFSGNTATTNEQDEHEERVRAMPLEDEISVSPHPKSSDVNSAEVQLSTISTLNEADKTDNTIFISEKCTQLLKELFANGEANGKMFYKVDDPTIKLVLQSHLNDSPQPVNLRVILRKLDEKKYETPHSFYYDMSTLIQNCLNYFTPVEYISYEIRKFQLTFTAKFREIFPPTGDSSDISPSIPHINASNIIPESRFMTTDKTVKSSPSSEQSIINDCKGISHPINRASNSRDSLTNSDSEVLFTNSRDYIQNNSASANSVNSLVEINEESNGSILTLKPTNAPEQNPLNTNKIVEVRPEAEEIMEDGQNSEEIRAKPNSEEIMADGQHSEEIMAGGQNSEEIRAKPNSEEIMAGGQNSEEIRADGQHSEEIMADGQHSEEIMVDGPNAEETTSGSDTEEMMADGREFELNSLNAESVVICEEAESSNDESGSIRMSVKLKSKLLNQICELQTVEPEKIDFLVEIIRSQETELIVDNWDEFEIDLDCLKNSTLNEIKSVVEQGLAHHQKEQHLYSQDLIVIDD